MIMTGARALHQPAQQPRRGRPHTGAVLRHGVAKQSAADVEPSPVAVLVAGIEPQISRQAHQEPKMEIGHPLFHPVELLHGGTEKIEKRFVGLDLPDQPVKDLGHEERNGTFAYIERDARERHQVAHLLHAVHLRVRLFDPFELEQEHRLEQRGLVAAPA